MLGISEGCTGGFRKPTLGQAFGKLNNSPQLEFFEFQQTNSPIAVESEDSLFGDKMYWL